MIERDRPRVSWPLLLAFACFSTLAVYCTAISLHTVDVGSGAVAADASLNEYHDMIAGTAGYPYQWRLLGSYLVYAGERATGIAPHTIDFALKTLLLFASTTLLFLFSRWYVSEAGALGVVGFYFLVTVAGFITEQYRIYFTNDYVMIACWFGAVYAVRSERYLAAAAFTLAGAWAKETMLLVPVLLAFRALRHPRARVPFLVTAAAFIVPTAILRSVYRAPLERWAWWDMMFKNVPFLQRSMAELSVTLKNNAKVALLYNVFWVMGARRVLTLGDPFMIDLGATGLVYLVIAYPVIYIRELRHFLPLAIIVLPMTINALEARAARPTRSAAPVR